MPTVGSSKINILGLPSNPINKLTLRFVPPESEEIFAFLSYKFNWLQ